MKPFPYAKLKAAADKLLKATGDETIVVTYVDVPAQNPIDPPVRTESRFNTNSPFLQYKQEDIDGTLILRGDQYLLVSGDGINLPVNANGMVLRGLENWKIIQIKEIKPGPLTILYKIQVRQ